MTSQAATPGPHPRRRAQKTLKAGTPLPATTNAENNAYGAEGKVDLGSQVTKNVTGRAFFDVFASARDAAVERDNDELDDEDDPPDESPRKSPSIASRRSPSRLSPIRRAPSPIQRPRPQIGTPEDERSPQNNSESESRDQLSTLRLPHRRLINNYETSPIAASSILRDRTNRSFSVTGLNSEFTYVAPPRIPRPETTIAATFVSPVARREVHVPTPSTLDMMHEAVSRWSRDSPTWVKLMPIIIPLSFLLLAMLGPSLLALAQRDYGILSTLSHILTSIYAGTIAMRDSALQAVPRANQASSNALRSVQADVATLRRDTDLQQQALREVRAVLPDALVLQRDVKTGQLEIPSDFWSALRYKSLDDSELQSSFKDKAPSQAWDTYLKKNDARLMQVISSSAASEARSTMQNHTYTGEIVRRHEFLKLMEENNAQHSATIAKQLETMEVNMRRQTHRILDEASSKPRSSGRASTSQYLEKLVIENLVQNHELLLKTINYFSAPLGAIVNPSLTSPTYYIPVPLSTIAYNWIFWRNTYMPYKPVMALQRWEEASDCWCAAPSDSKGSAQLAVSMPRAIVPRSITLENIPYSGTLDIASAPRNFEIWVHAPHIQPPSPEVQRLSIPECQSVDAPAEGYICIGGGEYDIHGLNHVQNFPLMQRGEVGFVKDVVVRVNNNWGREWTCLYRVRMHGDNENDLAGAAVGS